jgi:hypothetical protein
MDWNRIRARVHHMHAASSGWIKWRRASIERKTFRERVKCESRVHVRDGSSYELPCNRAVASLSVFTGVGPRGVSAAIAS